MEFRRWISEVARRGLGDAGAGGLDDPDGLRGRLEEAAGELAVRLEGAGPPGWRPLQLTKWSLGWFDRCDAAGLATLTGRRVEAEPSWPLLRGVALDALVAHSLIRGVVEDPVEAVDSVLRARGEDATAEAFAAALDPERRHDLAGLAAAAAELRVEDAWVPRVEVAVGAELADGALRLPGRADVLLGGPGTDRAAVVIEVKSAPTAYPQPHIAEVQHYALVCTLRHRGPPGALALWYPDGTTLALHVPGAAAAAAVRVEAVLQRIGGAIDGGGLAHRPGPHCGWCPNAARCRVARGGTVRGVTAPDRVPGADPADDDARDEEEW